MGLVKNRGRLKPAGTKASAAAITLIIEQFRVLYMHNIIVTII